MRKKLLKHCSAMLIGAAALTACTDSKYDLSDIDTTMHFGSGTLTLPASSTDSIYLGNLFDLAVDGPIKLVADPTSGIPGDSIYYLDVEGSADPTNINIDDITITKPQHAPINATIDLIDSENGVKGQSRHKRVRDNSTTIFKYNINDLGQILSANTKSAISSDVVDIKEIGFGLVTYTLNINVSTADADNISIINKLYLDSFTVNIPKGLDVKSCKYKGEDVSVADAKEKGLIVLSTRDEDGYAPASGPLQLVLTIDGASINDATDLHFNATNHSASMSGQIMLSGNVELTLGNIDQTKLDNAYQAKLQEEGFSDAEITVKRLALASGNYDDAVKKVLNPLYITGPGSFDKDFTVSSFSGSLRHEVDEIDNIELDDLPDFLEDDEVTLNLKNPQVFLKLYTSLETTISTDIQLIPYKKQGGADIVMKDESGNDITICVDNIEYDGTKRDTMLLCIAKDTSNITWPAEFSHLTYRKMNQVENIGDIIKKVPDMIGIKGKDGNSKLIVNLPECEDVAINNNYSVDFSYKVSNPLTFGEGFKIIYKDEDTGWDVAEDLEDIDVSTLELTGVASSNVPLGLKLTATPLGVDGQPISGITITYMNHDQSTYQSAGLEIPANALNANIRMRITASNGTLKLLDGIKYRAELTAEPSEHEFNALRTKSYLKLYNIRVSIVDGITIESE
ncbi:MAG: hypothetical protein K6F94_00980 [Bacteroidaceae bacterium]|nr:hypothetical protein [Bacteroidaceae bacterium]